VTGIVEFIEGLVFTAYWEAKVGPLRSVNWETYCLMSSIWTGLDAVDFWFERGLRKW
jgi:hypothetical protein